MNRESRILRFLAATTCLIFGSAACSTMRLKQYPEPPMVSFANSRSVNGVSVVAEPLLDKHQSKEYFGVDLLQKGIVAVYLSVKNDNLDTSFTIPADSISISKIGTNVSLNDPAHGDRAFGETALAISALLLINPLFLAVGAQQVSDASIITENFEAKRFRTKTIDPGHRASGFSYFPWEDLKALDKANICFTIIDSIAKAFSTACYPINLGLSS